MKRALLVAAAVALSGCDLAYSAVEPFPCPTDRQCPGGLSCVPGVGCQAAEADSLCFTKATDASADNALPNTDCAPAGEGASCFNGRCEIPCLTGNTCGDKRVCSLGSAVTTPGSCLVDCTEGGSCPGGMKCLPLWHDGQKGCFDPSATPPAACSSFESLLECGSKFNCGAAFFALCPTTAPTATSACPTTATCSATGCDCPAGYSLANCDGSACGDNCVAPSYGCKPDVPVIACGDSPAIASGTCVCTDGRQLPVACNTTTSCEQLCEM